MKTVTKHTPETALEFVEYLAREVRRRGITGELNAIEIADYIERGMRPNKRIQPTGYGDSTRPLDGTSNVNRPFWKHV